MLRRSLISSIATGTVLLATRPLWAKDSVDKDRNDSAVLRPATRVRRPVDDILDDIGKMILAYGAASGKGAIVIEIDYIGNESGSDKFPNDLGQFARNALEQIDQFQTYRVLPSAAATPRSVGIVLPQLLANRPKPPQATYRLVGVLEPSPEVFVKGRSGRADTSFGNGHTSTDGSATADRSQTITALTLGLTLEEPNSIAVRGATAEYRIDLEQKERNKTFGIYIGGNGIGFGSKLKISQDSADALHDVMAMNLVHVLGNALEIPYYRSNPAFSPDPNLENRMRSKFTRMTISQLELQLKLNMIVDGFEMDRRVGGLTAADHAVVAVEMHRRSLNAGDRIAMVELLMQFWNGLNYRQDATRVAGMLADGEWQVREAIDAQARRATDLTVDPTEFGFPAGTKILVIDMSRMANPLVEKQIAASLRTCNVCGDVRMHPQKPLLGVTLLSKTADAGYTISSRLGVDYVWLKSPTPRMLLVPPTSGTPSAGTVTIR